MIHRKSVLVIHCCVTNFPKIYQLKTTAYIIMSLVSTHDLSGSSKWERLLSDGSWGSRFSLKVQRGKDACPSLLCGCWLVSVPCRPLDRGHQLLFGFWSEPITGKTDVEAETPILWPPDAKSWLIWKDSDAGKGWGQEEKGTTEDEMVGWHPRLNGHEFRWTLGVGDGQGGLACCSSWGLRVRHDWVAELNWTYLSLVYWLVGSSML